MADANGAASAVASADGDVSTTTTAAALQTRLNDLFDNDTLWDADDTDDFVLALLRDLDVDGIDLVSARDLGSNSLLHTAALWNRRVIVDDMVRRGVALNARNANGHTPLDLATHYGHFDLAQQLQHYGGKHTCETERDVAVAQRDLATARNRDCEAETQDALTRLRAATHEREAIRVERDRLALLHSDVMRTSNAQAEQLVRLEAAVNELTREKHALRVRSIQLTDELAVEQAARSNAVQGWQAAEQVVVDMQRQLEQSREREEQALAMRNDALAERDSMRELARLAQLDQGVAKQLQTTAERERDAAVEQLLAAESSIANDQELWRVKGTEIERERRNIQVEIDRQTALLRNETRRLDKQVGALTATSAQQQRDISDTAAALADAQQQCTQQQRALNTATDRITSLDDQVRALQDERRSDHRTWRERLERSLKCAVATELHAMLEACVGAWRKLYACQERVYAFDIAALDAMFQLVGSSTSSSTSSSESGGLASPIGAKLLLSRQQSASTPSLKTRLLPALQDKGTKDALTTPRAVAGTGATTNALDGFVAHNYDPPLRFAVDLQLEAKLRSAEDALELPNDDLDAHSVAEHVALLCASLVASFDALTQYAVKYLEHFRKQAQAQEKMIERKDELIQRFTQHRHDKLKKQSPARFRDCSVRPTM